MKKPAIIIASFLAGTLFATATGVVFAEDGLQQVSALIRSDLSILVNGKPAQLNNEVLSYNGKTYLYLRDMETVAGVKVGWDATTKEINIQTSATGAVYGDTSTPPVSSTPQPDIQPIPNPPVQTVPNDPNLSLETWYSDGELDIYLIKNRKQVYDEVVKDDGILYVQYADKEYPTVYGKDIIRDKNRAILFSQTFLLNFISINDLSALKKYRVDAGGKIY